eukprot:Nitzschia sp. Nitz4//scaffold135_size62275//6003//6848//NITZ4_006344-RA/size62275-processed-gene-0.17-mRNA-1//1//CDS//3329535545//4417//frame0
MTASREKVEIESLGPLVPQSREELKAWPSGDFILESLSQYVDLLPNNNPSYWQAHARLALLRKYGLWNEENPSASDVVEKVTELWNKLVESPTTSNGSSDAAQQDLEQLVQSGGKSNNRVLQWAVMDCAAGCQFRLHAHPNIELVYCVKGELHEIRMDGEPFVKDFAKHPEDETQVVGPSLTTCKRPWKFQTIRKGDWLVNEVGSIHKSFTATNGDGCVLFCLWGGSHANILEEPPLVTDAVNHMDDQITQHCGCHPSSSELESIKETFLPPSERSSTQNN